MYKRNAWNGMDYPAYRSFPLPELAARSSGHRCFYKNTKRIISMLLYRTSTWFHRIALIFMVFLFLIDGAASEGHKQKYIENLMTLSLSELISVRVQG